MTLEKRFLQRVDKSIGCWLWQGSRTPDGYGRFTLNGVCHRAHRIAYELWVKSIPPGLTIDHLCEVKACVNPKHLEVVTTQVNSARYKERKLACKRGHVYTEVGFYKVKHKYGCGFGRACKACARERECRK